MAQLKLMKKEWFDWFKNTTLDNITAWTEYYYINPDSQHWISNYQLWDEDWELGELNSNGSPYPTKNSIRSKYDNPIRVLPNTQYFLKINTPQRICWYDSNDRFISLQYSSGLTTSPANAHYMRFALLSSYGTTYKYDICINVSKPTFNGHYEPRIIKIEDILGVVDLGTPNWSYDSTNELFYTTDLSALCKKVRGNAFTSTIYTNSGIKSLASMSDMEGQFLENGALYLKNTSYTDVTTFTQDMQGKYLIFIKATSPY